MSSDVRTELSTLTVATLRSFAGELQIKGRSRMRKAELVEALAETPGVERFVTATSAAPEAVAPEAVTSEAVTSEAVTSEAVAPEAVATGPTTPSPATQPVEEPAASPSGPVAKSETVPVERSRVAAERPVAERPAVDSAPPPADTSGAGPGSLGLLVVDPTCVFVFWDIDEDMIARARDRVGDPQGALVLRTYGVAGTETPTGGSIRGRFDLFVDGVKGEQYLQVSNPGQKMSCELGIESRDGRFHVFAWSNRLDLPADRQSPAREIRRMRIGGDRSRHWRARGAALPPGPGSAVVAAEAALRTDPEDVVRSPVPAESVTSDTVMPPEELAALFETMEFSVSISSEDAARRARRGLFSGAVGVSSSSAVKLKDPGRGGHAPDGSRVKISLPGLIAPESRVD